MTSTDPSLLIALQSLAFVAVTAAIGGAIAILIARPRTNRRPRRPRPRLSRGTSLAARVNLAAMLL